MRPSNISVTLFIFSLFALLLFVTPVCASDAVDVLLTERGKITSYFDQYYIVNVNGTVSITNPTDRDLYDVVVRYDLGSLSIIELDDKQYITQTSFNIARIPSNSTVSLPYNIVGISLSDPALPNKGILYSAVTRFNPVIYSDVFGQLQKASPENASLTGRPGRLISVTLRNPTGFQFTVNSMSVRKTPTLDPNTLLAEWKLINKTNPLTISPDQLFVRDILDTNSSEGEVYWLVADVFISRVNFIDDSNVTRYTQKNLTIPPELLNYTVNESNVTRDFIESPALYVRKLADRQIVTTDNPVVVSLIVNNFALRLINFTITDPLPPGFIFLGGDGWSLQGDVASFTGVVSAKSAAVPSYRLQLNDTSSAGFDFFDAATITYNGTSTRTNTVPFIRQYVPTQRVYVQKKLTFDNDQVTVTIDVQNLGSTPITGAILKDYLKDDDAFNQISQLPDDKGVWKIPQIAAGDRWEVTYYTTKDTQVNLLPSLYGVANGEVLKSLVLDNVVTTAWERVRTAGVEMLGVALLIGLPILYFVMRRRVNAPKAPENL